MSFRLLLVAVALCASSLLAADTLKLATTTSTYNSGLLAAILPDFTRQHGTEVKVIAVGTGKALRMGRDGDADVLLVHAPTAEQKFMDAGYGVDRLGVMYNDFVIVGPAADPAGVAGMNDAPAALAKIAASQTPFVSRGDDSGTHKKERLLWKDAGITPSGDWYREAGQGMGKVLQIASELQGYSLTDRGTWLAYEPKVQLQLVAEGDKRLFNPYSVMRVNPARYADLNHKGAIAFSQWLVSASTQKLIGEFKVNGKPLFVPSAGQE
ncbi:substrate-binding domain-containing protein [Motiliproteus sediminis]|uniref:substrate-binding domain-containing protein n=1 Tax=Motiliproteus sediminis TaxID=1468178 RepID=UPI001AEFD23B|nr:substrate-binding domain-containing protein [Motiliproteus sediminis]